MRNTVHDLAKSYATPKYPQPDLKFTVTYIRFMQGNMFGYYRQHPVNRARYMENSTGKCFVYVIEKI